MVANYRDLRAHDGPFFDHWRRRCMLAFGVAVPESREQLAEEVRTHADDL